MMTHTVAPQNRLKFDLGFNLEAVALTLYIFRDAFGGAARYYTSILHVGALWFLPDVVAMLCIGLFVQRCIIRNRSIVATLVLLQIVLSLGIGYFFLGTINALSSSFKMMLPVFVGFSFCDSNFGSYKKLLMIFTGVFYASVIGVFLSKYTTMPWTGFKYESFGAVREAGRLWWAAAEQRLSGFAADNTMAAFFILITFVVTSIRKSTLWCLIFGSIAVYAIKLTTSKTTMLVLLLYMVLMLLVRSLPERMKFRAVRTIALWSFASMFAPLILILLASGASVGNKDLLFSMMDRINNSWQLPFVYMSELMPVGFITGCGAGCFNYPQQLFSNLVSYWVPVDNFYIGTYLMFGLPFVLFMWMVFRTTFLVTDIYKLSLIFTVNLFTITVLNYGPSTGLLMIALSFSEVFSRHASVALQVPSRRPDSGRAGLSEEEHPAIGATVPRPAS
ncbi:hypothetical protein [Bradyrhizobium sp. AZCC 2230]|uniref:hypothetical protein n=1 Tax=Bradyrhizobium sp. AZCC 2230 TaxID=3117021 RepID=UPI002FF3A008